MLPESWKYDDFFDEIESEIPKALKLFYTEADCAYSLEGCGQAPRYDYDKF